MLKKYLILFFFFSFLNTVSVAQIVECKSQVEIEYQKNQDIIEINSLWVNYLKSSPDSLYNNQYWSQTDRIKYKSYDLIRSEGYLDLYGIAKAYGGMKNLVLSITPLDDKYYDIYSMFYWDNGGWPYVLAMTHVLSYKDESGEFVLTNWLDYYSRDWTLVEEGVCRFHYQNSKRNDEKIQKTIAYLDFLEKCFDVHFDHLDVYISSGMRETEKLKGFEYTIGSTVISDTLDVGATTDVDNQIIYSNSKKCGESYQGEFYQHELMRLLYVRYPDANRLLMAGLSEYFSETQIMRGRSFRSLFCDLDSFLDEHKEIDLRKLDDFESGNLTEKNYLIGLIIVKMIHERGGYETLKGAISSIHTDEQLIEYIEKYLGVPTDRIDAVFRGKIKQYATSGFSSAKWRQ